MAAPAAAPAPAKATPAPATAPAAAPAAAPSGVAVMLPLAGKDVTLNVRLTLDGPLTLRETPAAAPAPAPQPEGGSVAPALLLAALCSIAGMAVATMAPGLAGPVIARLGQGPLVPLTVAVLILVLVLTAFALGYLWGRGRQPSASGSTATKG